MSHMNTSEACALSLGGQLLALERAIAALPPKPEPRTYPRKPIPIRSTCAESKPYALALLSDTPITVAELYDQMKPQLPGLSKDTLRSALDQLAHAGQARRLERGTTGGAYIKYVKGDVK